MAKKKKARRRPSTNAASATSSKRLDKIEELAMKYRTCAEYEKDVREQKAKISGELKELLGALDAKKVEIGSVRVSAVTTVRESLDEMKLLKAGVSAKTIARCKTKSKPSYSVRVSELETPRDLALIVNEHEVA